MAAKYRTSNDNKLHSLPEGWEVVEPELHGVCRDFVTKMESFGPPGTADAAESARYPANKHFGLGADGRPFKYSHPERATFHVATAVAVPDLDTFETLRQSLTENQWIVHGLIPGYEDGPLVNIVSGNVLRVYLGLKKMPKGVSVPVPLGVFKAPDGRLWAARTKGNFDYSTIRMFDADMPGAMPDTLKWQDALEWREKVVRILPALGDAGTIMAASNSAHLIGPDGVSAFPSNNLHVYTQVEKGSLPPPFWLGSLKYWSVVAGMDWPKVTYHRQGDKAGEPLATLCGTIYDDTPMKTPHAVDYAGRPVISPELAAAGYRLLTPVEANTEGPFLTKVRGGRWDPETIQEPTRDVTEMHDRKYKCRSVRTKKPWVGVRAKGLTGDDDSRRAIPTTVSSLDTVVECLEYDDELDLGNGETISVREFAKGVANHVRGNATWRGSTSQNAYFGKHSNGEPFLYDKTMAHGRNSSSHPRPNREKPGGRSGRKKYRRCRNRSISCWRKLCGERWLPT